MANQLVDAPQEATTTEGKYFAIDKDISGGGLGHGVLIVNLAKLLTPPRRILRPKAGGFPVLPEPPLLVYDPALGDMPEDLEASLSGYWLVSARLKQLFQQLDPDGFEFLRCKFMLPDGTNGPPIFLCDVVRTLDSLDENRSEVNVIVSDEYEHGKAYDFSGSNLVFDEASVGSARIFRTPFNPQVFCDRVMRDALCSSDLSGVWLRDVTSL